MWWTPVLPSRRCSTQRQALVLHSAVPCCTFGSGSRPVRSRFCQAEGVQPTGKPITLNSTLTIIHPWPASSSLACKRLSQCCRLLHHAAPAGLEATCCDPVVASLSHTLLSPVRLPASRAQRRPACSFPPASQIGMDALVVAPISQASARQRAGRAGRTGPGAHRCARAACLHAASCRVAAFVNQPQ